MKFLSRIWRKPNSSRAARTLILLKPGIMLMRSYQTPIEQAKARVRTALADHSRAEMKTYLALVDDVYGEVK